MILNHQKTQLMIFNFTTKHQFTTNLKLQEHHLEVVKKAKLLGVIITDDLKWDENTAYLVKKGYSRLELLRKVAEITTSVLNFEKFTSNSTKILSISLTFCNR